ncbi:uncharacterized protein LOC128677355 [Plodia interpunctella]|uniref:uncharacterized protein LOC128677355 n=1 Tax=Plodia interpunctella TaxID=58824 RepID=UPI0023679D41|nr:uncharacterized protein LOC128677355 [Plodia interpunctella]
MTSCKIKPIVVDLNIGDQLTLISCGHVVVELIKFIAFQRLQIPYTYQWLKQIVNKKKMCENRDKKESFQSERHFHIASTALDNLDFILKSLLQEMSGSSIPEEVCIALGATPMTCKEMYRLILPTLCHKPQCHSSHIASDQKIQRSVFRTMVTSESLSKVFFDSLPPTNMHIFIRRNSLNNLNIPNSDSFELTSGCRIPRKTKIVVMNFRTNKENVSCCNDFEIFGETGGNNEDLDMEKKINFEEEFEEMESTDTMKWYQSTYVMKGFKDCVVNGNSVTNSWNDS